MTQDAEKTVKQFKNTSCVNSPQRYTFVLNTCLYLLSLYQVIFIFTVIRE